MTKKLQICRLEWVGFFYIWTFTGLLQNTTVRLGSGGVSCISEDVILEEVLFQVWALEEETSFNLNKKQPHSHLEKFSLSLQENSSA